MSAIDVILQALMYLEKHQSEEINCEKLAALFNYSPFYFHRCFRLLTGKTIAEYLRMRRLEFAAVLLITTEKSISEICFDSGFNSLQTFNRGFREKYKMSPKRFRKRGKFPSIQTAGEITDSYRHRKKGEVQMEPKFENKDEFYLVGVQGYTGSGKNVIGKAWSDFKSRFNEIENVMNPSVAYGYEDYSKDFDIEKLHFYYMAGIEVSSVENIPEGMCAKCQKPSLYAVFTVEGCNANGEIGKAFRYIYDEWLPNSEFAYNMECCGDFEFYGDEWNCTNPDGRMYIYIPIVKK